MNEFKFIESDLYTLKRMFPTRIKLLNRQEQTLNTNSGEIEYTTQELIIRRAVLFPEKKSTLIQALVGKQIGEALFLAERYVLIDYKDIPETFELSKATIVEHDSSFWKIMDISDYNGKAFRIGLKRISGDVNPATPDSASLGPFDENGNPL